MSNILAIDIILKRVNKCVLCNYNVCRISKKGYKGSKLLLFFSLKNLLNQGKYRNLILHEGKVDGCLKIGC